MAGKKGLVTLGCRTQYIFKVVGQGFHVAHPQHACRPFEAVGLPEQLLEHVGIVGMFFQMQEPNFQRVQMLFALGCKQLSQLFVFDHWYGHP